MQEIRIWSLGGEDPLEEEIAPHSSTVAWKIPWAEEPGRLQSMGLRRVGHDWATSLSLFTFLHWRRKWQPTPVFLPGDSQGWVSLVSCHLWGRTELDMTKRLSTIPEWSSGFPYFLQFKSEFGNKELMIWATISSQSCFCWLYRASPSLAVKNIINLISVLTIWWCPCAESSLVLLEEGVWYDQCILFTKLY